MNSILILSNTSEFISALASSLKEMGYYPSLVSSSTSALEKVEAEHPDAVFVDSKVLASISLKEFISACKKAAQPLVVGILSHEQLQGYDPTVGMDDFVLPPYDPLEVATRLRHLLWKTRGWNSGEILKVGDLLLDISKYEVSLAGKRIDLTFKEYELLRFLATTPARVFTREALLKQVWGYDYFGGTRTVDVHIRRLRSKIEDSNHVFIDTVRNVGYRFRK